MKNATIKLEMNVSVDDSTNLEELAKDMQKKLEGIYSGQMFVLENEFSNLIIIK